MYFNKIIGRRNEIAAIQRTLIEYTSFYNLKNISCSKRIHFYHNVTKTLVRPTSTPIITHNRPFIFKPFYNEPSWGINFPGQGLKKITSKEDDIKLEEKSIVLTYINRRIAEQEKGREKFPLLPDYKFYISLLSKIIFIGLFGYLIYPTIDDLVSITEEPVINPAIVPDKDTSFAVHVYKHIPLRLLSRLVGRFNDITIEKSIRSYFYKLYIKLFNVNMDDAIVKDLKAYKSLNQFFSRPIDTSLRPINEKALVTSPADGKILTFGRVVNGKVEQVKGLTYSLQKFLGPLTEAPKHDLHNANVGEGDKINWSVVKPGTYQKGLMHDPVNNDLYQCVVYLAPGDYHRFHSPVNWVMTHRRHFPGELLSVNPKVAGWVKNLFVVNERVVLSGEWDHGYFSMTAVGATNVGSIKIYADPSLATNPARFKPGSYFDFEFGRLTIPKGEILGNFSFGSTIVLVFEAPKDMKFDLAKEQKIKFGEGLTESEMEKQG